MNKIRIYHWQFYGKCIALFAQFLLIRIKTGRSSLIYLISYPSPYGGSEYQLQALIENLQSIGKKPLVLTTGVIEGGESHPLMLFLRKSNLSFLSLGNFDQIDFKKEPLKTLFLSLTFRILGARILHIYKPTAASLSLPAKKAGIKVIYTETAMARNTPFWSSMVTYVQMCDAIISVTQQSLNAWRKQFDYQGIGKVIPSFFKLKTGVTSRVPNPANYNIVYFGRMDKGKNLAFLLRAFMRIKSALPHATLTLIGGGPQRDLLLQMTRDLGLSSAVKFKGWLSEEPLFEELKDADLFCLPSLHEGNPCSINEALALGIPVLASRVGGIPEMIEEGHVGFLFDPENQRELEDLLLKLGSDLKLRTCLRENALKLPLASQNSEAILKTMEIYESLDKGKEPYISLLKARQYSTSPLFQS